MMEFDFATFVSERHARLLQEMQEERRAASLPQQSRRRPLVLLHRVLTHWHRALAATGARRPTQGNLQPSKE